MSDERREDTTPVVLVDRAMVGGFEFVYGGRPYVFKPGKMKLTVGADVARHYFSHPDNYQIWAKDLGRVFRVYVEDAPGFEGTADQLKSELGAEILDQTPIELDIRQEGWDTRAADRGRVVIRPVDIPATEMRDRQGTSPSVTFAER